MTFEEQFPSLKEKVQVEWFEGSPSDCDFLYTSDVQEHCLDKQRVRDALEKLRLLQGDFAPSQYDFVNIDALLRELGL